MTDFVSQEELDEFKESGFMTTHLSLEANQRRLDKEHRDEPIPPDYVPMVEALKKINEAVDEFNVEVWLKWLYSHQAHEEHAYLEANAANVNMLVGTSAGRVMITLRWRDQDPETEHHFVSMLGAAKLTLRDDYQPRVVHGLCGFQGIGMNSDRAAELILEACRLSKDLRNDIRPAPETVRFG